MRPKRVDIKRVSYPKLSKAENIQVFIRPLYVFGFLTFKKHTAVNIIFNGQIHKRKGLPLRSNKGRNGKRVKLYPACTEYGERRAFGRR